MTSLAPLLAFNGQTFPVSIVVHYERKRHSSASIRDLAIHLRIAKHLRAGDRKCHIDELTRATMSRIQQALEGKLISYPALADGELIHCYDQRFMLHFASDAKLKSPRVNIQSQAIKVNHPTIEHSSQLPELFMLTHRKLRASLAKHFAEKLCTDIELLNGHTLNQRQPIKIAWREQRTRWGSCSQNGHLSFSNRLLFLPSSLREYVFLHELCHLRELNHSRRFWTLLSDYMPDYEARRQLLKRYL